MSDKAELVRLNYTYVAENFDEFEKDKFYHHPDKEKVVLVYFNPDSSSGGQFVYNNFPYHLIREAAQSDNDFFEYLETYCYQELVDIDDEEFMDSAKQFAEAKCDFMGSDEETKNALLRIAA